jgi:hypothetical protein
MKMSKDPVINRYKDLVSRKLLEELSLRVPIKDLREFGAMEECTNIACVGCVRSDWCDKISKGKVGLHVYKNEMPAKRAGQEYRTESTSLIA